MLGQPDNTKLERYKYKISDILLTADGFDEPIVVDHQWVKSFIQENDYENAVSPRIQLTFHVKKEYYEKISLSANTLIATFTIYKIFVGNVTGETDRLKEEVIEQEYVWREYNLKAISDADLSTATPNILMEDEEYKNPSLEADNTQQSVQITLLLYDHTKMGQYRKNMYSIISGGKNDVLYHFFYDRGFSNVLMTPTDNSNGVYSIPYGHLGNNIHLLNKYYGIYNTPYLFFMDTDVTYLLEKGKVGNTLRKDELQSIMIFIEKENVDVSSTGSYVDIDNNVYVMNTTAVDIQDNDSAIDFAIGGTVKTIISGSGSVSTDKFGDYDIERAIVVDNAKHHSQLIYNIKENRRNVVLTFANIDLSIVSPNKKYSIIPDDTFYSNDYKLGGDYRMCKSIIAMRRTNEDELNSSIQIFLNKMPV